MIVWVAIGVFILVTTVFVVAACMLSSLISRDGGE